jgi:drug/metabolite transporter (DMT)-like permease
MPNTTDWLWLLVLAWLCTVLSFDLQLNALKKLSAFTANLTYNLEPVYGIILAFIFFKENENLHRQFYIGVLLILLAVALQMFRIAKEQRKLRIVQTGLLN